jgi:hypothetical protein
MRRLLGLAILVAMALALSTTGVMSSPSNSNTIYLPVVSDYSPVALSWTQRTSLLGWTTPLGGAAVAGGQIYDIVLDASYDNSIHALAYDPTTDSWTLRPGSISSPGCCVPMAVASATNGKIYAVDIDGSSPMTFEYDPSSDIWTTRAPIPAPAGYFGFGWVGATNGKLYAIGGSSSANTGLATLLIYDPSTDTWSTGASLPTGVYLPSVAATSDGKIYVFGDVIGEIYGTTSGSWTSFTPTYPGFVSHGMGATQAGDGRIYLVGGPPCQCNGIPPPTVLVYDPVANAWASQTNLPWGEQAPSVLVLNGYQLYVVGGFYGSGQDHRMAEATIPTLSSASR